MPKKSIPKGYTSKSIQDLSKESQQALFKLGQAIYNADFASRQLEKAQEEGYALRAELKALESQMAYAQRQEEAKPKEPTPAIESSDDSAV